MESDDRDRLKSICEAIRRGLQWDVREPLPSRLEELLRVLETLEPSARVAPTAEGQAPACR